MALHVFGPPQGAPVHNLHIFDFRTQEGTDILNSVFGNVSGIPAAGIDRVPVSGNLAMNRSFWDAAINDRMAATTPVNLDLESTYDATTGKALIKVKVAYTQDFAFAHSLSLVIMEDGMIDAQEYPDRIDTFYTFKHVVRDYITNINGTSILSYMASKTAGAV